MKDLHKTKKPTISVKLVLAHPRRKYIFEIDSMNYFEDLYDKLVVAKDFVKYGDLIFCKNDFVSAEIL